MVKHDFRFYLFYAFICASILFRPDAYAQDMHKNVPIAAQQTRVQIAAPCLETLKIEPIAAHKHMLAITTPAHLMWDIAPSSAETLYIRQSNCASQAPQKLSGDMVIELPSEMPLAIDSPKATVISITSRPSYLSLRTGGDTSIAATQQLNLLAQANASVTIDMLSGQNATASTGDSALHIKNTNADALSVRLADNSYFTIDKGRIQALAVESLSNKDSRFDGQAHFAWLHNKGRGNLFIQRIWGAVASQRDGAGMLDIQTQPLSPYKHK